MVLEGLGVAYLGAGLEGLDEVRGELNGGVAVI